MKFILLTTPIGSVAINQEQISGIVECDLKGENNTRVKTQIYMKGSDKPFNILEDFDTVGKKIW